MTQELIAQQAEVGIFTPPEIVLGNARTAAKALADVLSHKKKPVIINGEQYLEFEDWQTCGQFYGYTVKTGGAVSVEIDGVKGAKAQADLIDLKTGMYLGGAEAFCMRDEDYWNTRPKYEWQGEGANRKRVKVGDEVVPWFQLASMAQTRAGAKALRNRLAWVVVLAGYKATPAEEMTENTVRQKDRRTVDNTEHWCPIHNIAFFKKGRMKGWAHKIEGTDEWCNEEDIKEGAIELDASPEAKKNEPKEDIIESLSEADQPEQVSPTPEVTGPIDMEWLKESLNILQTKNLKAWSESSLLGYMKTTYKVEAETVLEAATKLDKGSAAHFVRKVQDTLDMA